MPNTDLEKARIQTPRGDPVWQYHNDNLLSLHANVIVWQHRKLLLGMNIFWNSELSLLLSHTFSLAFPIHVTIQLTAQLYFDYM